ncbi:hypothetical protein KFE25_003902 [Diacronema lutheri]|uniref:Major facilitator superfamily (MFS) profile domain-containing protein n=3 Tax=Diacronema lutheri TaxID=2081491 RepID=A0A8J6C8G9_DIALT|nr:hypothetical protein KFE25_003902 [Diacronema lutheri]
MRISQPATTFGASPAPCSAPGCSPAPAFADINALFLLYACAALGASGLVFGYDIGVISGALPLVREAFAFDTFETGLFVALPGLGAALGGPFAGLMCDALGRKRTVFAQNALVSAGVLLISLAQRHWHLYVGRFVMGIGGSFAAVASLAYLCELAPLSARGLVTSVFELLVVLGMLCAWVADWALLDSLGWRAMFALVLVVVAAQILAVLPLAESASWLLVHGERDECVRAIRRVYTSAEAAAREVERLEAELAQLRAHAAVPGARASDALREWRCPLALGLLLGVCMFLSGGVALRTYAVEVFRAAGLSAEHAGRLLVCLGVVKVVCTALAIALVDTVGRRPLLLTGVALMTAGFATLAASGAALAAGRRDADGLGALFGSALVISGYSYSFGPLTWLLWAELFPTALRGKAIGILNTASWIFGTAANFVFAPLQERIGSARLFCAFAVINCASFGLLAAAVVESSAKFPEQVREELEAMAQRGVRALNCRSPADASRGACIGEPGRAHHADAMPLAESRAARMH